MAAMSSQRSVAHQVAKRLDITTTTLYIYLSGDGSPKEPGKRLIGGAIVNA